MAVMTTIARASVLGTVAMMAPFFLVLPEPLVELLLPLAADVDL